MPYPAVSTQYGVMDYCGFKKISPIIIRVDWSGQPGSSAYSPLKSGQGRKDVRLPYTVTVIMRKWNCRSMAKAMEGSGWNGIGS